MKRILLFLIALFSTVFLWSQSIKVRKPKVEVVASVCGVNNGSMTLAQMLACGLTISDTADYKLEGFTLTWLNKEKTLICERVIRTEGYYSLTKLLPKLPHQSVYYFTRIRIRDKATQQLHIADDIVIRTFPEMK